MGECGCRHVQLVRGYSFEHCPRHSEENVSQLEARVAALSEKADYWEAYADEIQKLLKVGSDAAKRLLAEREAELDHLKRVFSKHLSELQEMMAEAMGGGNG